jgi:ABC-type hemin transport system ATPase subunit
MVQELPQDNLSEFLLTSYTSTCRQNLHAKFFKLLDKPTCARGVEVLKQIMKNVNDLNDENGTLVTMMKDLEKEI